MNNSLVPCAIHRVHFPTWNKAEWVRRTVHRQLFLRLKLSAFLCDNQNEVCFAFSPSGICFELPDLKHRRKKKKRKFKRTGLGHKCCCYCFSEWYQTNQWTYCYCYKNSVVDDDCIRCWKWVLCDDMIAVKQWTYQRVIMNAIAILWH